MESKRLAKAQAWSSDCALIHAFLFENTFMKFISFTFAHLASWVITPSIAELINLSMVQTSDLHCEGYLDWRSAKGFNFALPLMCWEMMGILLTLLRKLVILALALKWPLFMRLTASWTGLLSGHMIRGCLLSLIMSNSFSIPPANARASISQGLHLLQLSLCLELPNLTGHF